MTADAPADNVESQPDAEKADGAESIVDTLPEDLDVERASAQITFPNNSRRRIPAVLYVILGLLAIYLGIRADDSPLTNRGLAVAGVALVLFGLYGLWAGTRMTVDEQRALILAAAAMDFPIGHASAQQVWHGWRSRPTWRILVFSNENPPANRGIALVDAVDGRLIEHFSEPNPDITMPTA